MRGVEKPTQVSVNGESAQFTYDPETLSACVTIDEAEVSRELEVSFACGKRPAFAENPVENDIYQALLRCEMDALAKDDAYAMVRRLGRRALPQLRTLEHTHDRRGPNCHQRKVCCLDEGHGDQCDSGEDNDARPE